MILDQAEQKGTGRWTSQDALELGVPLTAITEAVFARSLSSLRDERVAAAECSPARSPARRRQDAVDRRRHPRRALRQQGRRLRPGLRADGRPPRKANDWDLDLGAMATIWRGGCIIRARFLNRISDAYDEPGRGRNLLIVPYFRDAVAEAQEPGAA